MTDREAQEIIRMVESNWSFDLEQARALWRQELLPYDAEIGTRAVARLARTSKFPPRLADLLEVVKMFHRERQGESAVEGEALPRPSSKERVPGWVKRYVAARFLYRRFEREQDMRPFPEQREYVDPRTTEWMPEEEWAEEATRVTDDDVWVNIGS